VIGAVVGLAAEARLARRLGLAAGIGSEGAQSLIASGVSGLVSFGIAGGLAPDLRCGTIVLASAVRMIDGATTAVDGEWRRRLAAAAPSFVDGVMLGADAIVADPAEKALLHRATGAAAVDLESHRVAAAATAAGIPFVILRAIADGADRALPPAALVPLAPEGRVDLRAVLCETLRRPRQIPQLLRVAQDTATALRALAHAGRLML
jgi:adenosylhomocysteine nucleosidase